jgi:hypothetical protein
MPAERERALHFRKPLVSGYGQLEIRKRPAICGCDGRSSRSRVHDAFREHKVLDAIRDAP